MKSSNCIVKFLSKKTKTNSSAWIMVDDSAMTDLIPLTQTARVTTGGKNSTDPRPYEKAGGCPAESLTEVINTYFRNRYTGQVAHIREIGGKLNLERICTGLPLWRDILDNPDNVGPSEYRAIAELLLDANNIGNLGGEVVDDVGVTKEDRDHSISILDELIDRAKSIKKDLKNLRFN